MLIPGTGLSMKFRGTAHGADPSNDTVFLSQVHGTAILREPVQGAEGDGMIFPAGKSLPGLRVADCIPVFAVWNSFTGAAHAGWRGLAGGIVENLILAVREPLKFLLLGPCICSSCYQVGDDVRTAVAFGDPAGLAGHPPGKVDLRGSVLRRVESVTGYPFQLLEIKGCTLESDSFYSHRRNGTAERNILWLAETFPGSHIQHPYHESIYAPPRGE